MAARSDLAPAEARVFRSYWDDGVLDLLAGSAVLLIGIGWLAGFPLAAVVVPPVALVLWPILRRRISNPRMGQVRFNAARRFRMRHGLIAVASLGVLLLGFFTTRVVTGRIPEIARSFAPGIPAFLLAALALSAAEALRLGRFAAYAAAFVAAGLVVALLDAEPGWAIVAGGAFATANGARMLSAFLQRFPPLPAEIDE